VSVHSLLCRKSPQCYLPGSYNLPPTRLECLVQQPIRKIWAPNSITPSSPRPQRRTRRRLSHPLRPPRRTSPPITSRSSLRRPLQRRSMSVRPASALSLPVVILLVTLEFIPANGITSVLSPVARRGARARTIYSNSESSSSLQFLSLAVYRVSVVALVSCKDPAPTSHLGAPALILLIYSIRAH
jgi:hypothetical protein